MAHAYQAEMWCDECAELIKAELADDSGDTDDYPQWYDDNAESDSPQHCASLGDCVNCDELSDGRKVGMLFGALTSYGEQYVRETVSAGGLVAELWAEHYSYLDFEGGAV